MATKKKPINWSDPKDIVSRIPILGFFVRFMEDAEVDYGTFIFFLSATLLLVMLIAPGISFPQVFAITVALSPLWLTWGAFVVFFNTWGSMIGKKFYLYNGRTTLRILLPPEVERSPEAMEYVITQIHNVQSVDNLFQIYRDGKQPLPFSFEIVSLGGEVRLYVNLPTRKSKPAFEANLYAQYPGVQIIEEPVDYAAEFAVEDLGKEYDLMSFHIGKKENVAATYKPITTYVDKGMMPEKTEEMARKQDPMTPMLEMLSSVGPHERVYVQFLATSWRKDKFKHGQLTLGEGDEWNKGVEDEINNVFNKRKPEEGPMINQVTEGDKFYIGMLERNMNKPAYVCAIRWVYIAKTGYFNGDFIAPFIRTFAQHNGAAALGVRWRTDFNYVDYVPGALKKKNELKVQEFKEYKLRKFYPKSAGDKPFYMTPEELATVWHIPGANAITPTLDRIPSKRSEAPANLPIGELPT